MKIWDSLKGSTLNTNITCDILLPLFSIFFHLPNFIYKKGFNDCQCIYLPWTFFWVNFWSSLGFFNFMACRYLKIMKLTWAHLFPLPTQLKSALVLPSHLILVNLNNIYLYTQFPTWKLFWLLLLPHIQLVTKSVTFIS